MTTDSTKKIVIVAGEASGDLHGANLVKAVWEMDPSIHFSGIGGKKMQKAGVNILFNAEEIAVVGFVEVLKHWSAIKKAFQIIKKRLINDRPDLLILIDYPGFNLRVAKIAKKANIKVLYYISPQIWAWHKSRIKIIKKYVDLMAVVFPFEVDFYQQQGVNAEFVGHPLIETAKPTTSKTSFCQQYHLDPSKPIVGLVPGSRKTEIKRLLPLMLQCAKQLKQYNADIQFVLPIAYSLSNEEITHYTTNTTNIKLIKNDTYNALNACDAAIATSGTVTLELALLETPFVMVYKINPITYFLGKHLVNLDTFGICNILAGKKVTKELIQHDATTANITAEIKRILENNLYRRQMVNEFHDIKNQLREAVSKKNIASVVVSALTT